MVTLEQKKKIVDELVEKFQKASGVYLVNFETMSVAQTNKFRVVIKEANLEYKVIKNTLLRKALEQVDGIDIPRELMFGQTGLVFAYDDPTVPAKLIKKFIDENDKPKFKGASLDGQIFDGTKLKEVAALPSKEDMYASIVGSIGAPASGIVGSIAAVIRDIASMIEEVGKKNDAA